MKTMKLKICYSNREAVEDALRSVNGRSTAHTYTQAEELIAVVEAAENALAALGITQKTRSGAVVNAVSGGRVPNAYKYARTGTAITLERGAAAWFLTSVQLVDLNQKGGKCPLTLTPAQDAEAIAALRKRYTVAQTV